jgi:hypothetical protein
MTWHCDMPNCAGAEPAAEAWTQAGIVVPWSESGPQHDDAVGSESILDQTEPTAATMLGSVADACWGEAQLPHTHRQLLVVRSPKHSAASGYYLDVVQKMFNVTGRPQAVGLYSNTCLSRHTALIVSSWSIRRLIRRLQLLQLLVKPSLLSCLRLTDPRLHQFLQQRLQGGTREGCPSSQIASASSPQGRP